MMTWNVQRLFEAGASGIRVAIPSVNGNSAERHDEPSSDHAAVAAPFDFGP
jgi:hypothetical protein